MIEILFRFGPEYVLVKVDGGTVTFGNTHFGAQTATIEGIRLDRAGVEKEHPDLKGDDDWKDKAIKRFKDKIMSYKTERERVTYIVDDLKKHGYIPVKLQEKGKRWEKL